MSFNQDIVARAKANGWFRDVLTTGPHSQVVVMSIPAGGEIGEELFAGVALPENGDEFWFEAAWQNRSRGPRMSFPRRTHGRRRGVIAPVPGAGRSARAGSPGCHIL